MSDGEPPRWTGGTARGDALVVLRPGDVIAGKYRVERLLGAGGMGSVYVAVNQVLQKRVALKVMGAAFSQQAGAVQRFFREAMSASQVRHPAIVEIYDAGSHEGAPWMAMQLLDGESLGQRIERGPLRSGELRAVFVPVLAALEVVHQTGIVHRDLKPDNIFLERLPDGSVQPKLLDFGIAKTQDGLDKLTATGAVMGTAHYLAPEQARDSSTVDLRTDLYAIGVVLYESLSGRMPHEANTLPELITKLISEDPPPLLDVAPRVPVAVANVVHWCLARDPAARPQRASDLAHHLGLALSGVPDEPVEVAPPGSAAAGGGRAVTGPADALAGTALGAIAGAAVAGSAPSSSPGWPGAAPLGAPPAGWTPGGSGPGAGPLPGAHPSSPGGPPAYGGFGAAAPAAFVGASGASSGSSMNRIVIAVVALMALGGACVFVAPVAISLLSFAAMGAGGASGGFGREWPRWWEEFRQPALIDVDGDGVRDVVGWSRRNIGTDLHELLCAFDGTDGHELWCADVGEQDDLHETETVFLDGDVAYFDHRGRVSAFRLSNGQPYEYQASVRGTPDEVCVLGGDRVAVRTEDRLWSIVAVRTGVVSAPSEAQPEGCAPARTTLPARGSIRFVSETWTELRRDRPRRPSLMTLRGAYTSRRGDMLLVGLAAVPGRTPGKLALMRQDEVVWEAIVAVDPLTAQAQPPEAIVVTDEVVYASYEMSARGDAPRHVTAFRLSDGQRLWDVALPIARGGHLGSLVGGDDLVLLSVNQILLAIDSRAGRVRFQLGEPTGF